MCPRLMPQGWARWSTSTTWRHARTPSCELPMRPEVYVISSRELGSSDLLNAEADRRWERQASGDQEAVEAKSGA